MSKETTTNAAQTLAIIAGRNEGRVSENEVIRQMYLYNITTNELLDQMNDEKKYRFEKQVDNSCIITPLI